MPGASRRTRLPARTSMGTADCCALSGAPARNVTMAISDRARCMETPAGDLAANLTSVCALREDTRSRDISRMPTPSFKTHPDTGLLVLRLGLGAILLPHGIFKVTHGVAWIAGPLGKHGLPAYLAYGV